MTKLIRNFTIASLVATCLLLAACSDEESDTLTAPTAFTAEYDTGAVHTTWEGAGNEDMFMVMRVEMTINETKMWQVPAEDSSYDDATAESGYTYTYMVHAMIGEDVSEPSNKVMVTIP